MNWTPIPDDLLLAASQCKPLAVERLHGYSTVIARLSSGGSITVAELAGLTRLSHTTAHEVLQRATTDHAHWRANQRNGLPDPPARRSHHRKADNGCPPPSEPVATGGRRADAGRMTDATPTPVIVERADAGRTPGGQPIGVDLGRAPFLRAPSTSAQRTEHEGGIAGELAGPRQPAPPPETTSRPVAGQTEERPPSRTERAEVAAAAPKGGPAPRHGVERSARRQPPSAPPRPSGGTTPAPAPGAQLGLNLAGQPAEVVGAAAIGDVGARDRLRQAWDAQTRAQFGDHPPVEVDGRMIPGGLVDLLGNLASGALVVRNVLLKAGIGNTRALLRLGQRDRQYHGHGTNAAIWGTIDDHLQTAFGIGLGALAPPEAAPGRGEPPRAGGGGNRGRSYLDSSAEALELLRTRRAAADPRPDDSDADHGPYIDHEEDTPWQTPTP